MARETVPLDFWFETLLPLSTINCLAFPYSGSGVALFAPWKKNLQDHAGLLAVKLPARETKLTLPPKTDLVALSHELADSIAQSDLVDSKLVLIGCSLGGWLAFEVARSLRRHEVKIELLIVAASRAPNGNWPRPCLQHLSDEDFIRELNSWYDAIPAAIANDVDARSLMLPAIRGDMTMLETYEYSPETPLDCELLSLCGADDRVVTNRHMAQWRQLAKTYKHRTIPGDHYFMRSQRDEVTQLIGRRLAQI